jgi:hypothetical protein
MLEDNTDAIEDVYINYLYNVTHEYKLYEDTGILFAHHLQQKLKEFVLSIIHMGAICHMYNVKAIQAPAMYPTACQHELLQ